MTPVPHTADTPSRPRRRTVLLVAAAAGVLVLALAALVVVLVVGRITGASDAAIPDGWLRAEFEVSYASPELAEGGPDVREDVGRMLVGRLRQLGADQARYEPRPDGVAVGVPTAHESALEELRTLSVTTSVALRLVTGEEATPAGCAADAASACSVDGQTRYLLGPVEVEGAHLAGATARLDDATGGWTILLTWNSAGQQAVAETTAAHVSERLAIVATGLVVSAPAIHEPIAGDEMLISGDFTREEVEYLAAELRLGALPVTVTGDLATTR